MEICCLKVAKAAVRAVLPRWHGVARRHFPEAMEGLPTLRIARREPTSELRKVDNRDHVRRTEGGSAVSLAVAAELRASAGVAVAAAQDPATAVRKEP